MKAYLLTEIIFMVIAFVAPDDGESPSAAAKLIARLLRAAMCGWAIYLLVHL